VLSFAGTNARSTSLLSLMLLTWKTVQRSMYMPFQKKFEKQVALLLARAFESHGLHSSESAYQRVQPLNGLLCRSSPTEALALCKLSNERKGFHSNESERALLVMRLVKH
jgi:hypothetical protein